jgi:CRP-like cAMP-binding protein
LEGEPVVFKKGQVLISEGDDGDCSYLIASGTVTQRLDDPDIADGDVPVLGKGTVVGEMAMLVEAVHETTIVAKSKVRALRFRRALIHGLMDRDPLLAEHFVEALRRRLEAFADRLREVDDTFSGADASRHLHAPAH